MCLAIPVQVKQILNPEQAVVDLNGISTTINVALVEELEVGDFVILHTGYALERLDTEEAEATLQLFAGLPANASQDQQPNQTSATDGTSAK